MADQVDSKSNVFPDEPAVPLRYRVFALEVDGFVADLKKIVMGDMPDFGDRPEGSKVLDVTGVPVAVGYLVDNKGNVAPANGREEPLMAHEPAYHDRSNPDAPHVIHDAAMYSTSEPPKTADKQAAKDGARVADGGPKKLP